MKQYELLITLNVFTVLATAFIIHISPYSVKLMNALAMLTICLTVWAATAMLLYIGNKSSINMWD